MMSSEAPQQVFTLLEKRKDFTETGLREEQNENENANSARREDFTEALGVKAGHGGVSDLVADSAQLSPSIPNSPNSLLHSPLKITDLPVELLTIIVHECYEEDAESLADVCHVFRVIAGSRLLKAISYSQKVVNGTLTLSNRQRLRIKEPPRVPFKAVHWILAVEGALTNVSSVACCLTNEYISELLKISSILKQLSICQAFFLSYVETDRASSPCHLAPNRSPFLTTVLEAFLLELLRKSPQNLRICAGFQLNEKASTVTSLPPMTTLTRANIDAPFFFTSSFRDWTISSLNASQINLTLGYYLSLLSALPSLFLPSLERFGIIKSLVDERITRASSAVTVRLRLAPARLQAAPSITALARLQSHFLPAGSGYSCKSCVISDQFRTGTTWLGHRVTLVRNDCLPVPSVAEATPTTLCLLSRY
ncbi:hypothetical protein D9758_012911 [Tetrapyrgos nigripes]|uniref:F-box domain-containing protein n=1 Tax=Tetrapyrgos nigripes TaxID=182062 RepID=A0A8H5CLI3_9AGAR|nr:hypothetical protein D9758_012911 [Tetrapyrgos nigripes]